MWWGWMWGGMWWGSTASGLKPKDTFSIEAADYIGRVVPNVKYSIATTRVSNAYPLIYRWKNSRASFMWIPENYFEAKWVKVARWRSFSKDDLESYAKYVVLWDKASKKIFKNSNPIWRKITVWNQIFTVIWVLENKDNWETDESWFMPITTWKKRFWAEKPDKIEVIVKNIKYSEATKLNIFYALYKYSGITNPKDIWVRVQTNKDALKFVDKFYWSMQLFLIWIGSISLLVWGIWVMNIMLVSVTERTREIWIRKSIWASRKDILLQFLMESILISIIWWILAIGLSYFAWDLITEMSKWEFTVYISSKVIMVASIISISAWVVFGLFPAWKASRLKPIDALRYE